METQRWLWDTGVFEGWKDCVSMCSGTFYVIIAQSYFLFLLVNSLLTIFRLYACKEEFVTIAYSEC